MLYTIQIKSLYYPYKMNTKIQHSLKSLRCNIIRGGRGRMVVGYTTTCIIITCPTKVVS
jgi:hypothetical protein